MIPRRTWLCVATWTAVAGGCSKTEPPAPEQPLLLSEVNRRLNDHESPPTIMPVALTIDRPHEAAAAEAPPERLLEQSAFGMSALPPAAHGQETQALSQAVKALRTKLSVIANNLANSETPGFKRGRVTLEDCAYQQVRLPGAQDAFNNYAPTGVALGGGCRVQGVGVDFSPGPIAETGRRLDVAIEGEGFFQVIDPTTNNFLYTRAGNFSLNSNGLLVVGSADTGRPVQPQISLPITTISVVISAEGNVSLQQYGQTQFAQVGQIQLAKFMNPEGLLKLGENMYQETLASGAAIFGQPGTNGLGVLRQGAIERSNVDFEEELQAWNETERTLRGLQRLLAPEHSAHRHVGT